MLVQKATLSLVIICSVAISAMKQSACHNGSPGKQPLPTVDLPKTLDTVQKQIDIAQALLDAANIKVQLCEEQVSFQVTRTNTVNGDFEVILSASGKRIAQKQTTMTFDLKRPAPAAAEARAHILPSASLSDIIVAAAKQYAAVKDNLASGLKKNNFSIDILFSIEYDATLGFSFKLFGNGADVGAELDNATQHELVLTFAESGKCP